MNLSQYMRIKMRKKGLTRNGLYVELKKLFGNNAVSSTTLANILNKGHVPSDYSILEKIANGLGVEYIEILDIAKKTEGIDVLESAKDQVLDLLKLRYSPLFDDENDIKYLLDESVRGAIVSPEFRELMHQVHKLPTDRRQAVIQGFLSMLKGIS